jgi:hypothetical protein
MEVCALVYGAPTPKSLAASAVRSDAIGPKRHLVRRNEIPLLGAKRIEIDGFLRSLMTQLRHCSVENRSHFYLPTCSKSRKGDDPWPLRRLPVGAAQ